MKGVSYEILMNGIRDSREAIKGKYIFYKCVKCQSIIPSIPKHNINCSCGNIGIDKDLNRLFVEDYSKFLVLRKVDGELNRH
jgi:hypothetical protein